MHLPFIYCKQERTSPPPNIWGSIPCTSSVIMQTQFNCFHVWEAGEGCPCCCTMGLFHTNELAWLESVHLSAAARRGTAPEEGYSFLRLELVIKMQISAAWFGSVRPKVPVEKPRWRLLVLGRDACTTRYDLEAKVVTHG